MTCGPTPGLDSGDWELNGMRRATIFAFVLIAASSVSLAQDKALISGYVHNNKNKALRDVEVHLTNASLRLDRMATTDEDGYYLFPLVDPSPCPQDQPEECYEVTASMPGKTFVPQRQQLAVEVGETRVIVPTFEEQPSADAVSRLRSRPQPNFGDQTGGVGGGVLTEARAKQSTSSAPTSLPSGHVVPAVLSGRSTLMPTAITYVPGRQAASIIWLNIEQQRAIHGFTGVCFHQVDIRTPFNQYDTGANGPLELLTIAPQARALSLLGSGITGFMGRQRVTAGLVSLSEWN